jgi:uncharacterized protein (DUF2236 family)
VSAPAQAFAPTIATLRPVDGSPATVRVTRMFEPGTLTWQVSREAVSFLGGGRALLMQVAHPAVAAGVGRHSDYDTHPWRRLYRTLDTTLKIAFGQPAVSQRAARRLAGVHSRVRGVTDDGIKYDATDPTLVLWVWATLVDTTVEIYTRCVKPLSAPVLERFYAEQLTFAEACGVPREVCPPTWRDFTDYVQTTVSDVLQVTEPAQAVAQSVVRSAPALLAPAFAAHSIVTVDLLPEVLRDSYDFPSWARNDKAARTILKTAHLVNRALPAPVRHAPVAALVAIPRR